MEDLEAENQTDIEDQITSLQEELNVLKDSLQNESENRQDIKDAITSKEQILSELLNKVHSTLVISRRSERVKAPTERMVIYQKEVTSKKEKRLLTLYEQ